MRAQAEWNVITHIARVARPTSCSTRSRISPAALLVNVIARISSARAWPVRSRYAIRWVSTRVLPEPAPARMSSGPAPWAPAARCGGLSPPRRASAAACGIVRLTIVRLTDDIRERAAWVAVRARRVRIGFGALAAYAATLPAEPPPSPDLGGADDEERAAFSLTLNAINFGSGWFPTLRKAPGVSGFRTVEAGVRANGPWTAEELVAMTPEWI